MTEISHHFRNVRFQLAISGNLTRRPALWEPTQGVQPKKLLAVQPLWEPTLVHKASSLRNYFLELKSSSILDLWIWKYCVSSSFSDFLPSSLKIAPENCLNCIAGEMCKRIFVQKRTCDVKQAISPKIWSSTGTQKFTCKAFERKCPSGRRTAEILTF